MTFWTGVLALGLGLGLLPAQPSATEIEESKRQLREAEASFQRAVEQHRALMENLTRRLGELEGRAGPGSATSPPPAVLASPLAGPTNAPATTSAESPPRSLADPIRLVGDSRAYLSFSVDGLMAVGGSTANDLEALQPGGHDPRQRGFTLQSLETVFDGKVDPYFRGLASVLFQIDVEGETVVELEEAYLETLALPANLQFRAGQFLTEFGRVNQTHAHTWDFADVPLVAGRFFGEDGLRNVGARVSWLMPTRFYSELFLALQNSGGETAYSFRNEHEGEPYLGRLHEQGSVKAFNDLLFTPRYAASFDLTDTQTLLAGASAAFGPNSSGADTTTQIYGLDLYWKWKSARHHGGFPFVSWQTEAMLRRYVAGAFSEDLDGSGALDPGEPDLNGDGVADAVPREAIEDWGLYTQLAWGFRKGWVAALRGDYVAPLETAAYEGVYGRDPARATRWRISPNLTWYPSEYSKIRLQYNYDDRDLIGGDHSVWLQLEFLLGSHAAHKF